MLALYGYSDVLPHTKDMHVGLPNDLKLDIDENDCLSLFVCFRDRGWGLKPTPANLM